MWRIGWLRRAGLPACPATGRAWRACRGACASAPSRSSSSLMTSESPLSGVPSCCMAVACNELCHVPLACLSPSMQA